MMTDQQHNTITKRPGRKLNNVWDYFTRSPLNKSPGHFSGECIFCKQKWNCVYVNHLQSHLANDCVECPCEVQNYYLGYITAENSNDDSNKRRRMNNQPSIEDYFENKSLPESKLNLINQALVCAFVCCGISYDIIENPFFLEFLKQLRPNYQPPTCKVLAGQLLEKETARVNLEVNKILEHEDNLTLG